MANSEIQVGEYCRTFYGDIFKVANFYKKGNIYTTVDERGVLFGNPRKVIKKHSFNIIDLIDVGDYINGEMVDTTTDGTLGIVIVDQFIPINEVEIISVVTKEQFKSMEYKVGGEDDQQR